MDGQAPLNITPGHPTDSYSLTQLPPNPISPEILTFHNEGDADEGDEDLGE